MSTPVLISIINQASAIADADVATATLALGKQLSRDFAPLWGLSPGLEFCPKGSAPQGNVMAYLVDAIPEAPGALGYHAVDDADGSITGIVGMAYIKVANIDGYDWRTTLSHELLELSADYAANGWSDAPDGTDIAQEVCDPVENDTYDIDGCPCSNFVTRAYFDDSAQPTEKLDFMGNLTVPFSLDAGGYYIKRTEPGQVNQVAAAHTEEGHVVIEVVPSHVAKRKGRSILAIFAGDYSDDRRQRKCAALWKRHAA